MSSSKSIGVITHPKILLMALREQDLQYDSLNAGGRSATPIYICFRELVAGVSQSAFCNLTRSLGGASLSVLLKLSLLKRIEFVF